MTNALILLTAVGLLSYGLARNNTRRGSLRPRLSGSTDSDDRDTARIRAELKARTP